MHHIMVGFQATRGALDGNRVTARGLHGCLYHVLQQFDPAETTWLHTHSTPQPYSLAPYYTPDGQLLGLRMATITDRASALVLQGWQQAQQVGYTLRLGPQTFVVSGLEWVPGASFAEIADSNDSDQMGLRFLSPTTFRQGPGALPLPLPANVFSWPLRVWHTYAPAVLQLPPDWPEWCARDIFVTGHDIQTASVALDTKVTFTGFVGEVDFTDYAGPARYLYAWQALTSLATFCGIGYKTTMGMGAVERL